MCLLNLIGGKTELSVGDGTAIVIQATSSKLT